MLWFASTILFLLWGLGMGSSHTLAGFIHVLPILAIMFGLISCIRREKIF